MKNQKKVLASCAVVAIALFYLAKESKATISASPAMTGKGVTAGASGILSDGTNIAVGGAAVATTATVRIRKPYADSSGVQLNVSNSSNTVSINGAITYGLIDAGSAFGPILTNITNTGTYYGIRAYSTRAGGSTDAGVLTLARSAWIYYGHNNGVAATAETTNSQGIYIQPDYGAGTITNAYGIYIDSPLTNGGTATNKYAIYQADSTAKNFFAGQMGGMVEGLHGYIDTAANTTYTIVLENEAPKQVTSVAGICKTGNITAAWKINGADITSCVSLAWTTSKLSSTCNTGVSNDMAANATLTLVTSANGTCTGLAWSVKTTRD